MDGVSTDFVLDGQSVVREKRNGTNYATYLVGPRGPEYRRDSGGQVKWYVYDGLGSVVSEVDESGNSSALRAYDVYGSVRSGDAGASSHKFVGGLGHASENETGLIYMRARYMDPSTGRFVSEDPGYNGMNWFAYGSGNPVGNVDPNGKFDVPYLLPEILGDILGLLGYFLVNKTEEVTLAYVLGIGGLAIGAICIPLTIKGIVDIAGPIVMRYVDKISRQLWENMESKANATAGSLTARVTGLIYGRQFLDAWEMAVDG